MELPVALRKLMQNDHETRGFVAHISKHEKLLKEQIQLLKEHTELLKEQNAVLTELNAKQKKRIEGLEIQMKEIKEMIFKPSKKKGRKKKRTCPPKGHKAHNRPIPDKIHNKVSLALDKCPDCGNELSKPVRTRKRYVENIRPPEPFNTEYEIPYYYCKHCKKQISPRPADAIPKCRFGIKLMLLVVFLRYGMLLPFGKIAKQLEIIYAIKISEGCLVDSITRFRNFAGPEFDRIKKEVRELSKIHADETGWRINGKKHWLWDFIGEKHSLLIIDRSRGSKVLYKNLGEKKGRIVNCDCYSAYDKFGGKQQKCCIASASKFKEFRKRWRYHPS